MRILIPGGSGQIGTILARHFHHLGDEVTVLSRAPQPAPWRVVPWNPPEPGNWMRELEGADVVINLAGKSVNCRYHPANRREILRSRVDSVRAVGRAIAECARPPRVWMQASTATIYCHRFTAANDEFTGILGGSEPGSPETWRFSIDVAKSWEAAVDEFRLPDTRVVKLRTAMTMSPDRGGVFDVLTTLAERGLGGPVGSGRQYVSWIHETDLCRAVDWLISHEELSGPVNLAAPIPLPYADFVRAIRKAGGIRLALGASEWMLEIATWLMRTESELVLKSRRVVPARLVGSGFTFHYPCWPEAASELTQRRGGLERVRSQQRCDRPGGQHCPRPDPLHTELRQS